MARDAERSALTPKQFPMHRMAPARGQRRIAGARRDACRNLICASASATSPACAKMRPSASRPRAHEAPFTSIDDVAIRAALRDDELQTLAHIGAFAPSA